jgi:hypothetical protein
MRLLEEYLGMILKSFWELTNDVAKDRAIEQLPTNFKSIA